MRDDTGVDRRHSRHPVVAFLGLMLAPVSRALSATDLAVNVTPGAACVLDSVRNQGEGLEVACYGGETLADGEVCITHVCVYRNPTNLFVGFFVIDNVAESLADAIAAAEITGAAPAASAPVSGCDAWVIGSAIFVRSGSTVQHTAITYRWRPFGADPARKAIPTSFDSVGVELADPDVGVFEFCGYLEAEYDAEDIADGDILTEIPLPPVYGKIGRLLYAVTEPITTAAKTTTLAVHIGDDPVTGPGGAFAGTKALGAAAAIGTAATADHGFGPGDTLSLVASDTTAFVEGRVSFKVELFRRVYAH